MDNSQVVVERLFRRSAGRITATLVRVLGPTHLDLVEDAVQEAMLRALRRWPFTGVPANPAGWLFTVARNHVLGVLRHDDVLRAKLPVLADDVVAELPDGDDELALVFLCCHPRLSVASQVALTLKTVGGLGVDEIAAALLATPKAVAQRIVRAKRVLRDVDLDIAGERLDGVLAVLYLLFNAGYDAPSGDRAVRWELCAEAIRLCRLLVDDPRTDRPRVRALLGLMLLHGGRLAARVDDHGDLLLLADQDRSRWDHGMVAEGVRVFSSACAGDEHSPFHTEAAIALCHVVPETDWELVVRLYDELLAVKPSPVVALNRAVAATMARGADPDELRRLRDDPVLRDYHRLPAALGALWLRAGEPGIAAELYSEALAKECSAPTRRFLLRQLERCR
ncbi:MAG: RNA polymerase subunit sigma-70 [Actinomycetota bacterium]|nr:RNA polymerase subunit sigma-70 [Actinomycetota bacterium]